jgi:hypothetical protein
VTRRYVGALPTVREICELIRLSGGEYVMLDAHVARLLEVDVSTLNYRTSRKFSLLSDLVSEELFVHDQGYGRNPPQLYTLFGITEAMTVVSDDPPGVRESALLQRIAQAFVRKDAGC